jgi:hypothetical protein
VATIGTVEEPRTMEIAATHDRGGRTSTFGHTPASARSGATWRGLEKRPTQVGADVGEGVRARRREDCARQPSTRRRRGSARDQSR